MFMSFSKIDLGSGVLQVIFFCAEGTISISFPSLWMTNKKYAKNS
jgi:hypothetical protein